MLTQIAYVPSELAVEQNAEGAFAGGMGRHSPNALDLSTNWTARFARALGS
jgi:hypothetical protein